MKNIMPLLFILLLFSCKSDQKSVGIPETSEKLSVSIDGTRTDAVDTIVSKKKVLDSLKINKD